MLDRNRGALLLLTAQKHAREHLPSPQNARRSRCLDRWLRVCYEWCHFQKSAGTVRSRFCKNRSKGLGDKFPQQAQSGSKPPCLPSVKPTGFAGWQAAKRALFALLASPFPVLQRLPIFNRGYVHKMLLKPSCRQRLGLNAQC